MEVTVDEAVSMFPRKTTVLNFYGFAKKGPRWKLSGTIPTDLQDRFPNLTVFRLYFQMGVNGVIPDSVWRIPRLRVLDISATQNTGHLTDSVGNAKELEYLSLQYGRTLSGHLPSAVGNWSKLRFFSIAVTNISGELPNAVGAWKRLQHFAAHGSGISGALPAAVGAWSELLVFLASRRTTGPLPEEIGRWHKVEHVEMGGAKIDGPLPDSVGNWTELCVVELGSCRLTGAIPETTRAWEKVIWVNLPNNNLSGSIPNAVGNWKLLASLNLASNNLSGPIPSGVGSWRWIHYLSFAHNKLSGPLPAGVGTWTELEQLWVQGNFLSGPLPDEVGNWGQLLRTNLSSNNFTGPLPKTVGAWKAADFLAFSNNSFSGAIPDEAANWRALEQLYLEDNLFTKFPRAEWPMMSRLHAGNNRFSSPIEAAGWQSVTELYLSNNQLSHLPDSDVMANMSKLQVLHVSNNKLTVFPKIEDLGELSYLDASFNRIQGPLPNMSRSKLTYLLLQNNSISGTSALPPNVVTLNLNGNKLTELPEATFDLRELKYLSVADNQIENWPPRGVYSRYTKDTCNFHPCEPRFGFARLRRLDASRNPLGGKVVRRRCVTTQSHIDASQDEVHLFLRSLSYLRELHEIVCSGCQLDGSLHAETLDGLGNDLPTMGHPSGEDFKSAYSCKDRAPAEPGYLSLWHLDLSKNNISEIHATPSLHLSSVDLSGNSLQKLHPAWFNLNAIKSLNRMDVSDNPKLRADVQKPKGSCKKRGETELASDPYAYDPHGNYECTGLCRGVVTSYVVGAELNVEALCRCREGYGGRGKDCEKCPDGTYYSRNDTFGTVSACVPCPAGSYTRSTGGTSISSCVCAAGSYLHEKNASCVQCPHWPFRTTEVDGETQEAACVCNTSYAGLKLNNGVCGCDDGKFLNHKSLSCHKCFNAEDCDWGTRIEHSVKPPPVKRGFWAVPVGDVQAFVRNNIWRCSSSSSCLYGGICAPGREGPACGQCQPRMYGGPSGDCRPCSESVNPEQQAWLLAFAAVMVLVPIVILLHLGLTAKNSIGGLVLHLKAVRVSLKQLVKHIQTVSVIGKFSVTWPPLAKAVFKVLEEFTINLPTLLSLGCLQEQTSASLEMFAKWGIPVVFVATAFIAMPTSWAVNGIVRHRKCSGLQGRIGDLRMSLKDVARVILFVATLFWSTLAACSLEMVTCMPSPNGQFTVATYPHILCSVHDKTFVMLGCFSILAVLVFLVLPLATLVHGQWWGARYLATTECADRGWYAFLFEDFRDAHLHWATIIMAKDAIFVAVPVAFPGEGAVQLLLTAAASAIHVCLVTMLSPFQDRSNTLLEAWNGATAAIVCIYSVGMGYDNAVGMEGVEILFQDGDQDPRYRGRALGMVIVQVITIAVPTMALLFQLCCAIDQTRKMLPKRLQPITQQESMEWVKDFFNSTQDLDDLASVVKNFDQTDTFTFRTLFQTTAATIGHQRLSKKSRSHLVRKASKYSNGSPSREKDNLCGCDSGSSSSDEASTSSPQRQGEALAVLQKKLDEAAGKEASHTELKAKDTEEKPEPREQLAGVGGSATSQRICMSL